MTSVLQHLMAAHDVALAAFDARQDDYDPENDNTGKEIDRIRFAIVAHRPTLDEVAEKAAFMLRNRTFTEWDDYDQRQLIEALTPVGPRMDPAADALAARASVETGAQPARASEATPALNPADRHMPAARACPAGFILLASIVGMAICGVWIAITWRAWA